MGKKLRRLASGSDVRRFWARYADYLEDHGIIRERRGILHAMASKTGNLEKLANE